MDKKEFKENNDTLITFGEEALTMRKTILEHKNIRKKW